jgi:quercetin dioxygenase-like cupin family protein
MMQRKALLTAALGRGRSVERVEIKRIELAPGQAAGLHQHPCPVVGYIVDGIIDFQIEGESAHRLTRGDAFFEPNRVRIAHFDNASRTDPAIFVAFYLLETADQELIEMLK